MKLKLSMKTIKTFIDYEGKKLKTSTPHIGKFQKGAAMPIEKGDFILLDYTAKVKETDTVFDTSLQEVAKEAKIYRENTLYEPMLVVVGEGWVLRGLDEKLPGLEVGQKTVVEIPPERAFGLRDPGKIKLIPLKKFKDQNISPSPGMEVEVDGKLATIRSVGAGRVQVDFNPPLAGRTLIYEVEVKQVLQSPLEKAKALLHRRIPPVNVDLFELEISEKAVTVTLPEESFALEGLQLAKRGLAADFMKFLPSVETVTFIERHRRKEAKAPPQPAGKEEKPEAAPPS